MHLLLAAGFMIYFFHGPSKILPQHAKEILSSALPPTENINNKIMEKVVLNATKNGIIKT